MRKTRIVATLGPATADQDTIDRLVDAGVDVFRQNFSHGDHDSHADLLERARAASDDAAVMLDTRGPDLRLGDVEAGVELAADMEVVLDGADEPGTADRLPLATPDILPELEEDDRVLLDDGRLELVVTEPGETVTCRVVYGGSLGSHDSVTVPGRDLGLRAPTEQDVDDITFGIEQGFDYVAASFVKTDDDIERIREVIAEEGGDMGIIAKLEHAKAIDNMDAIIAAADGVMVARGDLGVELPAASVPTHQKRIIRKCNRLGKPVITATEMLTSMTTSPRATRAEVSDIANAVLDGSDAVMLSEETAVGDYPVRTVAFMDEILRDVEAEWGDTLHHIDEQMGDVSETICRNVWEASRHLDLAYIVAHTTSGFTARNIAKYRPTTPIVAFTDSPAVRRQLSLVWGVEAVHVEFPDYVDQLISQSASYLLDEGMVDRDDLVAFTAGTPTSASGSTNMMEIQEIGTIIDSETRG